MFNSPLYYSPGIGGITEFEMSKRTKVTLLVDKVEDDRDESVDLNGYKESTVETERM